MQAYLLFDAALLAGTKELSELLEQPELIALYGDLGPGALEVGPLLIATSRVQELAQNLVVRRGAKERWACSQLITRARLEDLVEHLHGLRLVRARDDREFYFRYADGRAFQAMWQVLSDEQRVSLMGPIQSWQCVALDGTASRRVPPPIELTAEQARVPLHLAPLNGMRCWASREWRSSSRQQNFWRAQHSRPARETTWHVATGRGKPIAS